MSEGKDTEFVRFVCRGAGPESRTAYMCMEKERYERLIERPTSRLKAIMGPWPREGNMNSLWPEDISSKVEGTAPVNVLKVQASLLGTKTAGIVTAEVSRAIFDKAHEPDFGYDFFVVCQAIGDYHYRLFRIRYSLEFYPLTVQIDEEIRRRLGSEGFVLETDSVVVKEPAEFEKVLKAIFADRKTRRVIDALIMQSGDAEI